MKKLNVKYIGIVAIIAFSSFLIGNEAKLYIDNGVDYAVLNMENPPGNHAFLSTRVNSENGLGMYLESIGRLIIGTIDPCLLTIPSDTVKLMVHGEAWKTGGAFWESVSDARLKNTIVPMGESLEKFIDIDFCSYEYNDQPGRRWCGILAQEVINDFPHSVNTFTNEGEEYYSFNPNNLFYTGMKAIQELAQKAIEQEENIRELETELAAERRRNNAQQSEIDAIMAALAKLGIEIPQVKSALSSKHPVTTSGQTTAENDSPRLQQNIPNPARLSTYIPYYLPQNTRQASLVIQDMMGTPLVEYTLPTHQGEGKVEVDLSRLNLKSGTYTYTLKVNNRLAATRTMVLMTK